MLEKIINSLKSLGFDDKIAAYVVIFCSVVYLLTKLFHFWFNRKIDREAQQFETVNRFVDEESYLEKVKSQPHIIRKIIFSRIYWLRNYPLNEIDYLIEQENLDYTIYELSELKNASLLSFSSEKNKYIFIKNWLNVFWVKHYKLCTSIWLLLFIIYVLIVVGAKVLFNSETVFVLFLAGLVLLQIWLMNKTSAVKTYIRIFGSIKQ